MKGQYFLDACHSGKEQRGGGEEKICHILVL